MSDTGARHVRHIDAAEFSLNIDDQWWAAKRRDLMDDLVEWLDVQRAAELVKHAQHDQKSHGNWARGGSSVPVKALEDMALWTLDEVDDPAHMEYIKQLAYEGDYDEPIAEAGIKTPIRLKWGDTRQRPYFQDGNHRVAVARMLGLDRVPVEPSPFQPEEDQARVREWIEAQISKHAAPIHPGTGTDQSVHGGGGGGTATAERSEIRTFDHSGYNKSWLKGLERDTVIDGIPVTIRSYTNPQALGAMDRATDELTMAEDYVREAFESIPDELWEAADNPRVVVVANTDDHRLAHYESGMRSQAVSGEGLYILGSHSPDIDPIYANDQFYPDGDHTLYLSLDSQRPNQYDYYAVETVPKDRLRHNLVHELSHAVTMPRLFSTDKTDAILAGDLRKQVLSGLEFSAFEWTDDDLDHPWFYSKIQGGAPHEFVADAMAYRIQGRDDILSEAESKAPGLTEFIDSFFEGGEVPIMKGEKIPTTVSCGSADVYDKGNRLVKHAGPGPHPGTGTDQKVHGGGGGGEDYSGHVLGIPRTNLSRALQEFVDTNSEWTDSLGRKFYVNNSNEVWVQSADGTMKSRFATKDRNGWFIWGKHGLGEGVGQVTDTMSVEALGDYLEGRPTLEGDRFGTWEMDEPPAPTFDLPSEKQQGVARKRIEYLERQMSRINEQLSEIQGEAHHLGEDRIGRVAELKADLADLESEHFTLNRYLDTPQLFEGHGIKPKPTKVKDIVSFSGKPGTIIDENPVEEARGINTDPYAIFEAELEMPDGTTYRSVVDEVVAGSSYSGASDYVTVRGRLLDGDDNSIAKFERILHDDGHVYNSSFFVNPSQTGKGVGSLFWSHWEQELSNAGFDYMTVSAADIGRYAWVKAGYTGGDVHAWVEDLKNYTTDPDALSEYLDDKWHEALLDVGGDDYEIEVRDGELTIYKDGISEYYDTAWSDYVTQYGNYGYSEYDAQEMMDLASDSYAMRSFAEDTLERLSYFEDFEGKELTLNDIDWEDFDPADFSMITDPSVREDAQRLIDEFESYGYVEPLDFAELGAGTSRHIGKEIILNGPGWEGEKDISWLRETIEKILREMDDSYKRVLHEWAQTNPAAVENDAPEFWAAVRQVIDRRRAERLVKHAGPGPHPGTGSPQSAHRGGGSTPARLRLNIDDNPKFVRLASRLHEKAVAAESDISPMLQSVASDTGGKLVGFEHRIKSERSIRDKIYRDLRQAEELGISTTPEEVASNIRDLNRYSISWPADETWVERHTRALESLKAQGWEVYDHKYKSAWGAGDHYDGTNLQLHKGDTFIEVQLHSHKSYPIKQQSDKLYSKVRLLPPDNPERKALLDEMYDLWNKDRSHVPPGANQLGTPTSFLLKAEPVIITYTDPEGNPVARLTIRDGIVYAGSRELSITPAEIAGHGGSADYRVETLVKHAAPIHPGTGTDQSVHGGGGTDTDPSFAYVERSTGGSIQLHFTGDDKDKWTDRTRGIVRNAVSLFEEEFPNVLPSGIEFYLEDFALTEAEDTDVFAYVSINPLTGVPREWAVHINSQQMPEGGITGKDGVFTSWEELIDMHGGNWTSISLEVGREFGTDTLLESTIVHELAHLIPYGPVEQMALPHYSSDWFEGPTTPMKDDRLPSRYAGVAPHEFMAEAFTEVIYFGDDAGPYSKQIVDTLVNR